MAGRIRPAGHRLPTPGLDQHEGLVNPIVNVVNNQGKALDLINQDLAQIRHQLSVEAIRNTLTSEEKFRSNHFHLSTEITETEERTAMCPMEKIVSRLSLIKPIGQFVSDDGNRI